MGANHERDVLVRLRRTHSANDFAGNRSKERADVGTPQTGERTAASDAHRGDARRDQTKKNGQSPCRTLSFKEVRRDMRLERKEPDYDPGLMELVDRARPKTRSECRGQVRPCLFVSCRHHLYLEVNEANGSVKLNFPDLEPWELTESCALDAAENEQGLTLDEVGQRLNLTRERTRQLEWVGLAKIRHDI